MSRRTKRVEILAPAGSPICLQAALNAGCDAIYFGVRGFNMRAGAKNFALDDLDSLVTTCHDQNVKAYLALNTIQYQQELPQMVNAVTRAAGAGVDAVICWDPAVIQTCNDLGIEPHLSTQASVSNSAGLLFYYRHFGIKRFVLARECSLEQIIAMQQAVILELGHAAAEEIEIEVFAHGAMCVSLSGRCFLSEFSFGRSANRGDCLQPCRREYRIIDTDGETEYEIGKDYILSPKDLTTLPFIEQLLDAGVASLKLEGRNRNPEYVDAVTRAYRQAVDFYYDHRTDDDFIPTFEAFKTSLMEGVAKVYNRGFSAGFYQGKPTDQWARTYGSKATRKKAGVGIVTKYYRKPGVAEINVQSNGFKVGDDLIFQGPTTGSVTQTVESMEVNHAQVDSAIQGELVAVKVDNRLRPNDNVFVWHHTTEENM